MKSPSSRDEFWVRTRRDLENSRQKKIDLMRSINANKGTKIKKKSKGNYPTIAIGAIMNK